MVGGGGGKVRIGFVNALGDQRWFGLGAPLVQSACRGRQGWC